MQTPDELRAEADRLRKNADAVNLQATRLLTLARKAEREERQAREAAANKEHFDRMFREIGEPLAGLNEEQHSIVYTQAWEHGHASGYDEVAGYYGDFAEMARRLLAARK